MSDDDVVSLAEAAKLSGISTDALRLRWRRGTLPGYKSGRRLLLYRDRLPRCDRSFERTAEHLATERIRSEEIVLLKTQLEVKDKQIAELHVLLGQAQQRLAPPVTDQPGGWWRRLFRRSQ